MQELDKILEEIELEKKRLVFYPDCSSAFSAVQIRTIEKIEKIICKYMSIRNHMNDDWIPVEKKLPNGCYKCEVTLDSGIRSIGWYNKIDYIWFDTKGDVIDVIAWKEPSEPYRPERSDNHDGE